MASQTLAVQPDTVWTLTGGINRTVAVALPDDDGTSFISGIGLQVTDATVDNPSLGPATITNVQVVARGLTTPIADTLVIAASDDAWANSSTSSPVLTTSYADYSLNMATAPSGGAWSPAKLNSLALRLTSPDINTARVTSWYVIVTYVPATGTRHESPGGKLLFLDIVL